MKTEAAQINLILAWTGILLGFVSGMVLGLFFHREGWLGGYTSFKRRMYRLAHISFFGLGAVNLLFWLTVKTLAASGSLLAVASWAFVLGAITMPICCIVMAHIPKLRLVFAVPVMSLIAGGILTLVAIGRGVNANAMGHNGPFSLSPTLSRWARVRPSSVMVIAYASSTVSAARNSENRQTILPLPAGEGRGEGESLESPLLSRVSNQSRLNNLNSIQP